MDFAKDPLGYIAEKMQEASAGLAGTVLPELEKLTHPDLSTEWFLSAYQVSFALSIFMWVAFLGWNFVELARHRVSGDEVAATLGVYTPMFLGGVIFGPAIGTFLLKLTGAVTDALIGWGVGGSAQATTQTLQDAIAAGESDKIVGGAIVAIIFFACLIVALLLAFLILLIMLVTLYLAGAVLPLSLVWLTQPRHRGKGLKVAMVWVGVCCSHVLLFLLLGVAFRMIGGLASNFDQPSMTILANLAAASIALLMATLSPLALLKFAPVGPSSAGGGGPSISVPGQRRSGGGYAESAGDSQTAQMARDTASDGGGDDGGSESAGGGGAGSSTGGLTGRLAAARAAREAGTSSSSMESTDGGGEAAGGGGGTDTASSGLAGAGTSAADGATAVSAGAGKAEGAGDKLSSAGQATTATGVGAPAGAAMFAVGEGLKAAGAVAGQTAQLAQAGGDMAAEHMEHGGNEGGSDADT